MENEWYLQNVHTSLINTVWMVQCVSPISTYWYRETGSGFVIWVYERWLKAMANPSFRNSIFLQPATSAAFLIRTIWFSSKWFGTYGSTPYDNAYHNNNSICVCHLHSLLQEIEKRYKVRQNRIVSVRWFHTFGKVYTFHFSYLLSREEFLPLVAVWGSLYHENTWKICYKAQSLICY